MKKHIPNFSQLFLASVVQSGEGFLVIFLYFYFYEILRIYIYAVPIWILMILSLNFDKTRNFFLNKENQKVDLNYFCYPQPLTFFCFASLIQKSLEIYGIWTILPWLVIIYFNNFVSKNYRILILPILSKILDVNITYFKQNSQSV